MFDKAVLFTEIDAKKHVDRSIIMTSKWMKDFGKASNTRVESCREKK